MKSQLLNRSTDLQEQEESYVLIFESGDEVMTELKKFMQENTVAAARFSAIGAFSGATLAYFDWEKKEYQNFSINEQVEVLTLTGDVALKEGKPAIHAHVIVGFKDGSTKGGHLQKAHVRPTLEVMLEKSPAYLRKSFDDESGLMLIDLTASQ
jgi:predicted DNA-binding protein with PD1-like motif